MIDYTSGWLPGDAPEVGWLGGWLLQIRIVIVSWILEAVKKKARVLPWPDRLLVRISDPRTAFS
ncbi:hypothetical protein [Azonexus hydrophilus]|jgi:hypothetical protein|uniref:Transposase DDE domain-containing protein n=1 Tax=Azonexus hydrophilus TaxID=418702 RepID=A0ABZ2XG63_9RHOO|nr:hypothetical protein [Azonexus hydrophilus]MBS4020260.1 hypothetical protein [Dechloromonas sp.]